MFIIILFMIILNIIYNLSGLFSVLAFIVWSINLFMTTMILIQDPRNLWIRIVQIISIIFILYIIFLNINKLYDSIYTFAYIIPLSTIKTKPFHNYFNRNMCYSINRITYLEDFFNHKICFLINPEVSFFNFSDSLEVKTFLEDLKEDKIYVATFEFICSFSTYNEEGPTINLSKPIIITKNSNTQTISKFIHSRINECVDTFYLEWFIIF